MSYFYGTLKGTRGEATRCGDKSSGLTVIAASWKGAIRTTLYTEDEVDYALVEMIPWMGQGTSQTLYEGPICKPQQA